MTIATTFTITLAGAAFADTVNFDNLKTGAPPPGWTATKTGTGQAKWTVETDDTAPSKPNVLKRSGEATYPVCIKNGTSLKDGFVEEIRALLRQRHHQQPGQDDDFTMRNLEEVFAAQETSARVMAWLLAVIASVSLIVGGIGIMNIMLVSVSERTHEIGLRQAVGATTGDILMQFLIEAVAISLVGGIAGIGVGIVTSVIISHVAQWSTVLGAGSIALAFAFSGLVGIFFGYYPARKAAFLDPIDALRYE